MDGDVANLPLMTRISRLAAISLLAILVFAVSVPSYATEGESEAEPETTETTVAEEPVFEDGEPAVVIPPIEEEPEEQPWTSRFIYPTIVAVTIILLIVIAIWYNRSIRRKYEVVPE